MSVSKEEFNPQKTRDPVLILSNILLLLITVVFLWVTFSYYQSRIQAVTLDENRYLTAEWQLLGELKAQTDKQLSEKEREIAELQRKYAELLRQNASDEELEQVQSQLKKARAEKDVILSQRVQTGQKAEGVNTAFDVSSVSALLEAEIKKLNQELEQSKDRLESLRAELIHAETEHSQAVQNYSNEIQALSSELNRYRTTHSSVVEELQQKSAILDRLRTPDIEEINTRVLLKAIVSSPTVRSEYPQLQAELDRYFQVLANQHILEGREAAYREAIELLERASER